MLFVLPITGGVFLPNPNSRFCLDLRDKEINWCRSTKMRKHLPDFFVSVKVALKDDLLAASR